MPWLQYGKLSAKVQGGEFQTDPLPDKQLALLVENLNHPSLHAKKYDEARGVWQARVNYTWRFYFRIEGNVYLLEEIKHHPK